MQVLAKRMRALIASAAFALVGVSALASSGCTTYRIRSAEDHGAMKVLKLETIKTTNAFLWVDVEHQFWLCQDTGDDLVCRRSCGQNRDLQCPTFVASDGGMTTNTR